MSKKEKNNKKQKHSIRNFLFNLLFTYEDESNDSKNKKVVVSKKKYTNFDMCLCGFMLLILGIVVGCLITIYTNSVLGFKFDTRTSDFLRTYNYIKNNYYEKVDDDLLIESAISGMLSSLGDENSYFMDADSTDSFNTSVDGYYVGLGITIQYDSSKNTVVEVFENSPAMKAGVKVGDIITKVNKKNVTKKNSSQISDLIQGKVGKKVKLTVKRDNEEKEFDLKLAKIEIQSVYSELKEENNSKIGYLYIENFASNTYSQFKKELTSLENQDISSLIIDVRNNSGGHLAQVSDILDLFFKKGTVLYQIQSKSKTVKYKAKTNSKRNYPVVVVVNENSASASEVLTACFKENYSDATIVGVTTYGKGTVQQAFDLSLGSSYKFTTEKWLTPKGKWIHKKGIEPDVKIELEDENDTDLQLQEAIKILSNK